MKNSYIFDFHIENMVKGCYVKKASCRFQAGEEKNAVNINKRQGRIVYAEVKEEDMDGKACLLYTSREAMVPAVDAFFQ